MSKARGMRFARMDHCFEFELDGQSTVQCVDAPNIMRWVRKRMWSEWLGVHKSVELGWGSLVSP